MRRIDSGLLIFAFFLLGLGLAGCSEPGMQMGVIAQGNPKWSDFGSEDNASKIDLYPINASTLKMLADNGGVLKSIRESQQPDSPHYEYLIGAQDILRVTVWDHPELNNPGAITGAAAAPLPGMSTTSTTLLSGTVSDSTARIVNDDGTMFYPYVGVVRVQGKTPAEVQRFLASRLAKTIRDPQVEVVVSSYRSQRAYVTGEVKAPGVIPITDVPLRIADVVTAAGGLNADADLTGVTLTKNDGSITALDLYALLYLGDLSQNLTVSSGDVLNIPEQRFKKVFVLGEVVKPVALPLPRGRYTLNEALADAGGVNQLTAQASQIYVIRGTPARPEVFHLNAKTPDALVMADAFDLRPRDIIFVDAAPIVRVGRVVLQILPSLQALQAGKYLGQ